MQPYLRRNLSLFFLSKLCSFVHRNCFASFYRAVQLRPFSLGRTQQRAYLQTSHQQFKLTRQMSTNSKFVRNRINKLIGKSERTKERPAKASPRQTKKTPTPQGSLFVDYTYIRLQNQTGKMSQNYNFLCYKDNRVYENYAFPSKATSRYDNDEESNFSQIKEDILRGWNALREEAVESPDCMEKSTEEIP